MINLLSNIKLITNIIAFVNAIKEILDDSSDEINETKEIVKGIIEGFKALGEKIEPAKAIYSAIKGKLK